MVGKTKFINETNIEKFHVMLVRFFIKKNATKQTV